MNSERRILVTGASSYAGARIYQTLRSKFISPSKVTGTYCGNQLFPELIRLDLTEAGTVQTLTSELRPNWIVHIAAISNQAGCDKDIDRAHKVNLDGVQAIVNAANEIGSAVIFISSESAYDASDYGKLKKRGEEIVKGCVAGYVILQPAMIFGLSPNVSNDRPYNRLLKAIERGSARADADLQFFPTWLGHLAEVISLIIERNIRNEVIPVTADRLSTRLELTGKVLDAFQIGVAAEHSGNPGSNAPLTQEALKRLALPVYTTEEVFELVTAETLEYFREKSVAEGSPVES